MNDSLLEILCLIVIQSFKFVEKSIRVYSKTFLFKQIFLFSNHLHLDTLFAVFFPRVTLHRFII